MTLGEKLKEARQQFGWSQEELADKLFVSRAAIAKWETDGGVPDMPNLKTIADLLQVSVDYLLDHNAEPIKYKVKEHININDYGKGIKQRKTDRAIRVKYPDAEIHTLVPKQKLTKSEKVIDTILWLSPINACGIPDVINSLKLAGKYYLVIKGERQYIVLVADEYIESQELAFKVTEKKFEFGNFVFTVGCALKPIKA